MGVNARREWGLDVKEGRYVVLIGTDNLRGMRVRVLGRWGSFWMTGGSGG